MVLERAMSHPLMLMTTANDVVISEENPCISIPDGKVHVLSAQVRLPHVRMLYRYELLRQMWASHNIAREVVTKRSSSNRVIINDHY